MAMIKSKQIQSVDASKVTQNANSRFVTDAEKTAWGNKADATSATSSVNGLMSKEDKAKLDTVAENANNYVHPDSHAASMITEDATHRFVSDVEKGVYADKYTKTEVDNMISQLEAGIEWKDSVATFADIATTYPTPTTGWVVTVDDTGAPYRFNGTAWVDFPIATYVKATQTTDGLMSKEDKTKLDGVAENANNYVHPANHVATVITQDETHRFVTDVEKSAWDAKASTAVATTSANGLMSAGDKTKIDGLYKPVFKTAVVSPSAPGQTVIATGIKTDGTGTYHTKDLAISLAVNGFTQTPGLDYTVSENASNEIEVAWVGRHFTLETDDELAITFLQDM